MHIHTYKLRLAFVHLEVLGGVFKTYTLKIVLHIRFLSTNVCLQFLLNVEDKEFLSHNRHRKVLICTQPQASKTKMSTASFKQNLAMSETVSSKRSLDHQTISITPNNFLLQANLASIKHENPLSYIKYPLSSKMQFFSVIQDQTLTSRIILLYVKQPQSYISNAAHFPWFIITLCCRTKTCMTTTCLGFEITQEVSLRFTCSRWGDIFLR